MRTNKNCILSKNCDHQKDFVIFIKIVFSGLEFKLLGMKMKFTGSIALPTRIPKMCFFGQGSPKFGEGTAEIIIKVHKATRSRLVALHPKSLTVIMTSFLVLNVTEHEVLWSKC